MNAIFVPHWIGGPATTRITPVCRPLQGGISARYAHHDQNDRQQECENKCATDDRAMHKHRSPRELSQPAKEEGGWFRQEKVPSYPPFAFLVSSS